MKQKETKTNIEVNIYGTRFTVTVPFSGQDAVRATETQMKAYFKSLRETHSTKRTAECMAMMAFHYASNYFALNAEMEAAVAEAEELIRDARSICGTETEDGEDIDRTEYGEY